MAARASIRISIAWLPDPHSEPTDTLSLNCGDYYVDLRILLADGSLDWAMAGERVVLVEDPLKISFLKSIDSHPLPHHPDVGTFHPLPANPEQDLETGFMPCPDRDGAITDYEEIWAQGDLASVAGGRAWILRSITDDGNEGKVWLGRVGGYFIGLDGSRGEGKFAAIREECKAGEEKWERKHGIGNSERIPSLVGRKSGKFEGEEKWTIGQVVEISDIEGKWKVLAFETGEA